MKAKTSARRSPRCATALKATRPSGGPSVFAFAGKYLNIRPTPPSIKTRRSAIGHFLKWSEVEELNTFSRSDAHDYQQILAGLFESGDIAGATGNHRLSCVRAMFSHAIKIEAYSGANPFAGFTKFPEMSRSFYLQRADIPILLSCCPPFLSGMVSDNLYLGLRAGEARGLLRASFRPEEGVSGYISLNVADTKGGKLKARHGAYLAAKTARIALIPEVCARMKRQPVTLAHPYFYDADGQPVSKSRLERAIKRAFEAATPRLAELRGLSLPNFQTLVREAGGFTWHTLRHTAATWDGFEAGFSESELMQKYRWSDRKMCSRYVHSGDEYAERAARKRMEVG